MFERFTEAARRVVVQAQEEARVLEHDYIGTEHVLLGLFYDGGGIPARALDAFDVTLEEVRARVARIVGRGDEVTAGEIPFTPRVKKVLELALREALHLGHNYIGPGHILLGLVREGEGVAARILLDFDATPRAVAEKVLELLGVQAPETYLKAIERPWRERPARAIFTEARALRAATLHLVAGWLLFVVALGIGILLGWAIWG